ncbi:hypothetical protein [Granulicella sp. S156]|uniref:hypothetical protein n=1 Tax=Granulicella sp. S156 TaxID=1747224 RepID=UPI00131B811F|nr:hypothetical protein [Granulicella sp. S156]
MNRTVDNAPKQNVRPFAADRCDDYFIELCALSTTDALTLEQRRQLELHLSVCANCREIKDQYDALIATTLPAMAAELAQEGIDHTPGSWSIEQAEASLMERIDRENIVPEKPAEPSLQASGWRGLPWSYAGAAVFIVASLFIGYRIGVLRERSSQMAAALPAQHVDNPHHDLNNSSVSPSPVRQERELQADRTADLRKQLQASSLEVDQLKEQLRKLQGDLAERTSAQDRGTQDRAELEQKLALTQSNAQTLQDELNAAANQASQRDTKSPALQAQVNELTAAMREKDQQIAQREELLEHDRDIRDLMGARDLYIGEIYDVAKTGKTQKPYGRVFYTKGQSLVFYAYDLDQQPGVKLASTFQAWGRRGIDQQHDINLGIFYQDDENKKRWVLKSSDSTTLAQIDAVFVTVEPHGESTKPSGKPLLFTYLRLTPNHP